MKTNQQLLVFSAVLAIAALVVPLRLSAQDEGMTQERAAAETEEKPDSLDNGEFNKPANMWPKGSYVFVTAGEARTTHLGPTGLWGIPAGQNIWVKRITPGSPADGKVLKDDIIYAVNGKGFPAGRDARYYFANAITKAETKEGGGKMVLDIRRNGNLIKVPIQLKVMGSFSSTTPWNCEKSRNIVAGAEEYMLKGLRPETGLPDDDTYMYDPWHDSVLFLMATGDPKVQGLVRRHIHDFMKFMDKWKSGELIRGNMWPYGGWGMAYTKFLFGEYYHLTGDPSVLPYLESMANGTFRKVGSTKGPQQMDYSWPPRPSGYGTHPNAQMVGTMGDLLANEAGLKVNKEKMLYDLKYLYYKRAEYGHVAYNGYGAKPFSRRQSEAPLEITAEHKKTGTYSSMNGKLGTAAALYSMVDGYKKAVDMCSIRCVYAFNHTNKGHGGVWFNGFWTPIGAHHAGPEKFTHFMKGQQWWRELYRDHTGAMWQTGNAYKYKKDTLGTGFAIHRVIHRKKLRMFGAPKSMFSPTAPAYMKGALAAHRSRDYARAEQLTRKLLADGKVPANDKERVNHFLNSVKALKESVEYDLTFTEKLINKGNYALANVEYPQLKMVTSPDNPRLKAIAKALASPQAQAHIAAAERQKRKEAGAKRDANIAARKSAGGNFEQHVASMVVLVKDGAKYKGPKGTRKGTMYPIYAEGEQQQWRRLVMKNLKEAPAGWEQPNFDDSKWEAKWKQKKRVSGAMPASWRNLYAALFRTHFDVNDVNKFSGLRVRMQARGLTDFTLFMNGHAVAISPKTKGTSFELTPESFKLLKKGRNTLAVCAQRGYGKHGLSIRLEGILKNPPRVEITNKKKGKKKTPKAPKKKGTKKRKK